VIDVYRLLVEELDTMSVAEIRAELEKTKEFVDVVDNDTVDKLYGMVQYLLDEIEGMEGKSEYLLSD
jgi:predicted DNA-binding transcriptional regulator